MFTANKGVDLQEAAVARDIHITDKATYFSKAQSLLNLKIEKKPVTMTVVINPISEAFEIVAKHFIFSAIFLSQ